ncbi:hypothetical protein BU24DRAFT_24757 [Aaosphaeria arxii CBS 175.79]|uniref:Uncharacterized protein n=1 Tax=Aaosphaeria arxii CBS 175.79 TaxID=1450172 RepID=A0A6A5Y8U3_9PLEO|nr:uncharacterized protein BU24DRAFT_24757 [Aaosphaeria arxii CBS 175.79]KAF2021643.1 hypothetical protein BU24DRAFT_24757 [Aaosphaeria arxii CBS 175.79]
MGRFFIPRQWRLPKFVYALMILELPFTVANLTLFGIASPNLYRTILWAEGGRRGFNSDPTTILYAYANYRPVKMPIVWSNFNTQYNLVIGVLCMFFWLVKTPMWLLHVFYPILSLPLHIALTTLWAYSLYVQTAPDTIDPKRINNGPPWFITKNCNIVEDKNVRHYCMQAKASFAVSVCMLVINASFLILTIYSLVPTKEARAAHETKVAEKKAEKEKWAALEASMDHNDMTAEEQWQHMWELQQLPRTPGTAGGFKHPMTPRTRAFSALDGGHEQAPMPADGFYTRDAPKSPRMMQQQAEWYPPPNSQQQESWHPPQPQQEISPVHQYEDWKGKGSAY